ncbi:cd05a64f-32e7-480b-ae91-dcfb771a580e [Sclerotinia trifoliorum]|uniref:Cd05a64f-32e7-480b-ae91-dcfb771a580e n=1 Tax=Sclerotinia trifoliorum TaxID=28548 RepID=A0A8H2VQS0_9HELO|nr:cd05a64f-32e7-480b-ae91-dcfb771a580e [Sclerotinia trifoliorum]
MKTFTYWKWSMLTYHPYLKNSSISIGKQVLWVKPVIESATTKILFVVTAVPGGALTYAIVFNIDTIVVKLISGRKVRNEWLTSIYRVGISAFKVYLARMYGKEASEVRRL